MKWISCISLGTALFCLYRFSRLFLSPLLAALPVFIFSQYIGVVWWTMSGLESMFYCALSLLLVWQCCIALGYRTVEEKRETAFSTTSWVITNITLLLLCLTRFEGPIWVLPLACFILCCIQQDRMNKVIRNPHNYYLGFAITFFCFLLPYSLYFIWRLSYFGHLIPNSYSCKSWIANQLFVVDYDYFSTIFPLFIVSLPYFLHARDCRHWLLWLPFTLYGVMLWRADPVVTDLLRLVLGPYALFCVGAVLGLVQFVRYFSLKIDPKLIATVAMILFVSWFMGGDSQDYLQRRMAHYQERTENRLQLARVLNTQALDGEAVLLTDCGLIPFAVNKNIRFIDTQCLNNALVTQKPYVHHLELYADYLMTQVKPEWVITNYYPLNQHGDYLVHVLEGKKFFADYKLVTTLKSKEMLMDPSAKTALRVDYIYRLYQRKN